VASVIIINANVIITTVITVIMTLTSASTCARVGRLYLSCLCLTERWRDLQPAEALSSALLIGSRSSSSSGDTVTSW
jgi:hypothetical protein